MNPIMRKTAIGVLLLYAAAVLFYAFPVIVDGLRFVISTAAAFYAMSPLEQIYYASCLVVAGAAAYMIFATCYEDGILGKLALGAVCIGAGAALFGALPAVRHEVRAADAFIVCGVALFFARHLQRFWRHRARRRDAL